MWISQPGDLNPFDLLKLPRHNISPTVRYPKIYLSNCNKITSFANTALDCPGLRPGRAFWAMGAKVGCPCALMGAFFQYFTWFSCVFPVIWSKIAPYFRAIFFKWVGPMSPSVKTQGDHCKYDPFLAAMRRWSLMVVQSTNAHCWHITTLPVRLHNHLLVCITIQWHSHGPVYFVVQ